MNPSPTELSILKLLWRDGAKSIGEIHADIQAELDWSRSSTRKTVERMVDKDMLCLEKVHGLSVYTARIEKVPTLAGLIQAFTRSVLSLDGPLPVSTLTGSQILSQDELDELADWLETHSGEDAAKGA